MVPSGDALPHRADEENRSLIARAPRTDPQLFPRSEAAFQWRRRGPEQQIQSHHEKILRVPHLPLPRTRAVSLTWQTARARINPRVFLTNQNHRQMENQQRDSESATGLVVVLETNDQIRLAMAK